MMLVFFLERKYGISNVCGVAKAVIIVPFNMTRSVIITFKVDGLTMSPVMAMLV